MADSTTQTLDNLGSASWPSESSWQQEQGRFLPTYLAVSCVCRKSREVSRYQSAAYVINRGRGGSYELGNECDSGRSGIFISVTY